MIPKEKSLISVKLRENLKKGIIDAEKKKNIGIIHIYSTYNNTIITLTDIMGNTLAWKSAGTQGFKGSEKCSPHAARQASEVLAKLAKELKITMVLIKLNGFGPGRKGAVKGIKARRIKVLSIEDITPIPHNGCRPRKRRRK